MFMSMYLANLLFVQAFKGKVPLLFHVGFIKFFGVRENAPNSVPMLVVIDLGSFQYIWMGVEKHFNLDCPKCSNTLVWVWVPKPHSHNSRKYH